LHGSVSGAHRSHRHLAQDNQQHSPQWTIKVFCVVSADGLDLLDVPACWYRVLASPHMLTMLWGSALRPIGCGENGGPGTVALWPWLSSPLRLLPIVSIRPLTSLSDAPMNLSQASIGSSGLARNIRSLANALKATNCCWHRWSPLVCQR
jgi:hypothetical protein